VCPEGSLTATGTEGGGDFAAVFSTLSGAIDRVFVTNPGSGYRGTIQLHSTVYATCVYFELVPMPSGIISKVTVLDSGHGYTSAPQLTISTRGGSNSGAGCEGFDLRAQVGDRTTNTFSAASSGSGSVVSLGQGASTEDDFYVGMTLVTLAGNASAATITKYSGASRVAELSPPLGTDVSRGEGYGITPTPLRVLLDSARSVDWVSKLTGRTQTALACKCADNTAQSALLNYTSMSAIMDAGGCSTGYKCSLTLATSAPAHDGLFIGETIHLSIGGAGVSAEILEYTGTSRTAVVAVAGSSLSVFRNNIGFAQAVPANTAYLLSASHIVTLGDGDRNLTLAGAPYGIYLDDKSARVDAALAGRHFLCDQLVGDNPPAPWIQVPMRKTFAFRSVPRVGSPGTLTVAAEGRGFDDLLWRGNNITVTGEHGELLGVLFEDGEMDKKRQEGGE
jgi:hypothetical protein